MKTYLNAQRLFALVFTALLAGTSLAAVVVVDREGTPVREAVELIPGTEGARQSRSVTVDQVDKRFVPFVSIAAPGSTVLFPNSDDVRHHVYSFSDANTFELKLYHSNDADPIRFDNEGLVTLGCNVHDTMKGYILITSLGGAISDERGNVDIETVPEGPLTVWHPQITGWQSLSVTDNTLILPFIWDPADPQAPKTRETLEERLKRFRKNED